MPGWVDRDDLTRLEDAEGVEAERIFLELMIPHHHGGVDMAQIAVDEAQGRQVRTLARVDRRVADGGDPRCWSRCSPRAAGPVA